MSGVQKPHSELVEKIRFEFRPHQTVDAGYYDDRAYIQRTEHVPEGCYRCELDTALDGLVEQLDVARVALDRGAADYVGLLEQLEALREALQEIDLYAMRFDGGAVVGAGRLARAALASFPATRYGGLTREEWAEYLSTKGDSNPASGERVAAGLPSSTSETSGANQSPEDSSPASSHDAALDLAEAARLGNSSPAFVRCTDCPYDLCDQGQRCLKASSPASSPPSFFGVERCAICEGLDQPGLIHNPHAPYCSESPPAESRCTCRNFGPYEYREVDPKCAVHAPASGSSNVSADTLRRQGFTWTGDSNQDSAPAKERS